MASTALKMPPEASQVQNKISEHPPTPEERNYAFCQETIGWRNALEEGALELAKRLKKIRDQEMYLPAWESWSLYLEDIKVKDSVASRMITAYEKWVLEGGFSAKEVAPIGWSTLYDARHHVSREVLDNLILKEGKGTRDYILELNSGVSMENCRHDYYKLEVCRRCGEKHQILE